MIRFLLVLATLGVTIYAAIDCLRTPESEVRLMPKPLWLIVIVLLLPLGGVAYLVAGRGVDEEPPPPPSPGPRVKAPDDDPDFLRSLKRRPPRDPRRDEQA